MGPELEQEGDEVNSGTWDAGGLRASPQSAPLSGQNSLESVQLGGKTLRCRHQRVPTKQPVTPQQSHVPCTKASDQHLVPSYTGTGDPFCEESP